MILVGIDVAKDNHECFIRTLEGNILHKPFSITNNLEGFEELYYLARSCLLLFSILYKLINSENRYRFDKVQHWTWICSFNFLQTADSTKLRLIQILDSEIEEIEEQIQKQVQDSPIATIPGISFRMAAMIQAEAGDFNKFLFRLVSMWCPDKKKRAEGKHYFVALSHVAKKLVRIICHLQKTGESFNIFLDS